jgi:hypothetical protein
MGTLILRASFSAIGAVIWTATIQKKINKLIKG